MNSFHQTVADCLQCYNCSRQRRRIVDSISYHNNLSAACFFFFYEFSFVRRKFVLNREIPMRIFVLQSIKTLLHPPRNAAFIIFKRKVITSNCCLFAFYHHFLLHLSPLKTFRILCIFFIMQALTSIYSRNRPVLAFCLQPDHTGIYPILAEQIVRLPLFSNCAIR